MQNTVQLDWISRPTHKLKATLHHPCSMRESERLRLARNSGACSTKNGKAEHKVLTRWQRQMQIYLPYITYSYCCCSGHADDVKHFMNLQYIQSINVQSPPGKMQLFLTLSTIPYPFPPWNAYSIGFHPCQGLFSRSHSPIYGAESSWQRFPSWEARCCSSLLTLLFMGQNQVGNVSLVEKLGVAHHYWVPNSE